MAMYLFLAIIIYDKIIATYLFCVFEKLIWIIMEVKKAIFQSFCLLDKQNGKEKCRKIRIFRMVNRLYR